MRECRRHRCRCRHQIDVVASFVGVHHEIVAVARIDEIVSAVAVSPVQVDVVVAIVGVDLDRDIAVLLDDVGVVRSVDAVAIARPFGKTIEIYG